MIPISLELQGTERKQIVSGDVRVLLNDRVSQVKTLGSTIFYQRHFYAAGIVTDSRVYFLTEVFGNLHLSTIGVSNLGAQGVTIPVDVTTIALAREQGVALSKGNSSIYAHYITGTTVYSWNQAEYDLNGISAVGTSVLLTGSVPSPFVTGQSVYTPYVNIDNEHRTLYLTFHQRSDIVGGSFFYTTYFAKRSSDSAAFPTPKRIDNINYPTNYISSDAQRKAYLNTHSAGNYMALFNIGITDNNFPPYYAQYNYVKSRLAPNSNKLDNENIAANGIIYPDAVNTTFPNNQTITEVKGISETFLSVNMQNYYVTDGTKPMFSRTWQYKGGYQRSYDRYTPAVYGTAIEYKTLSYRGQSFDFDIDLRGIDQSGTSSFTTGTSVLVNSYIGSTALNLISYNNSNNESANLVISNTNVG